MGDIIGKLLLALPNFLNDLVDVFSNPKTFLDSLDFNTKKTFPRAAIFYGVSMLVCFIVDIIFIDAWKQESFLKFFELLCVDGFIFLVNLLWLKMSWRIVAGVAPMKKLTVFSAYTQGAANLIGVFITLPFTARIKFDDPKGFAILLSDDESAVVGLFYQPAHIKLVLLTFLIIIVYLVAMFVWLFLVWGSFRKINEVSRIRSGVAFIVFACLAIFMFLVSAQIKLT